MPYKAPNIIKNINIFRNFLFPYHVILAVMLNAKIPVQHLHGLNGALVNQDIVTKITERKIESESGIKNRQFQVNEMYPSMSRWKNRGF